MLALIIRGFRLVQNVGNNFFPLIRGHINRIIAVGKLGWHRNFDTGFEKNIPFKIPCARFF